MYDFGDCFENCCDTIITDAVFGNVEVLQALIRAYGSSNRIAAIISKAVVIAG